MLALRGCCRSSGRGGRTSSRAVGGGDPLVLALGVEGRGEGGGRVLSLLVFLFPAVGEELFIVVVVVVVREEAALSAGGARRAAAEQEVDERAHFGVVGVCCEKSTAARGTAVSSSVVDRSKGLVGRRDGPLAEGGAVACFFWRGREGGEREEEKERRGGERGRGNDVLMLRCSSASRLRPASRSPSFSNPPDAQVYRTTTLG